MQDITVVLPALEEEEAIGKVIDDIRGVLPGCKILVAYQPSTNGTAKIIAAKGVDCITEDKRGKGYAVRTAMRSVDTRFVIMMDSDFTYPAKHIPELLEGLEDVSMGYRANREQGAMSSANWFGNRCLSLMASILYRRRVRDVCTGMWAFRRGVLDKFELESGGFTLEADLFVNCVRNRCKIKQIPIDYRARLDGSLPKLRIVDGVNIGLFLVKKRLNVIENWAWSLCPLDQCQHYNEATKYERKCYHEPQCWKGRLSRWVRIRRVMRYKKNGW